MRRGPLRRSSPGFARRIAAAALLSALIPASAASAVEPPSSNRSQAAERRVSADLKAEFRRQGLTWGAPVLIRIFKEEAELELWVSGDSRYRLFRRYPICAFSGRLGPKLKEGDRQAPEGFYRVRPRQMNPHSRYHLSFNLGYPNAFDRAHGRTGSYLMVHGNCVSVGCYAMASSWLPFGGGRNRPIEEIWTVMTAAFRAGQKAVPVHAFPFSLTDGNLARHADNRWHGFWRMLQPGFAVFEATARPPRIEVRDGRYRVIPG